MLFRFLGVFTVLRVRIYIKYIKLTASPESGLDC